MEIHIFHSIRSIQQLSLYIKSQNLNINQAITYLIFVIPNMNISIVQTSHRPRFNRVEIHTFHSIQSIQQLSLYIQSQNLNINQAITYLIFVNPNMNISIVQTSHRPRFSRVEMHTFHSIQSIQQLSLYI